MKKTTLRLMALVALATFTITSCKKDKVEDNDNEVITTMTLTLTPVSGGTPLTFTYDDPDGPGGNAPTQQAISLPANRSYTAAVTLLNKTVNPVVNVTTDVAAEATAHRFYYIPTAGVNVSVSGLNNDANGVPLGITSTWTTTTASTGNLKVTLRHYPGTPPNKATADLVTDSKSSTDIEVNFAVTIL